MDLNHLLVCLSCLIITVLSNSIREDSGREETNESTGYEDLSKIEEPNGGVQGENSAAFSNTKETLNESKNYSIYDDDGVPDMKVKYHELLRSYYEGKNFDNNLQPTDSFEANFNLDSWTFESFTESYLEITDSSPAIDSYSSSSNSYAGSPKSPNNHEFYQNISKNYENSTIEILETTVDTDASQSSTEIWLTESSAMEGSVNNNVDIHGNLGSNQTSSDVVSNSTSEHGINKITRRHEIAETSPEPLFKLKEFGPEQLEAIEKLRDLQKLKNAKLSTDLQNNGLTITDNDETKWHSSQAKLDMIEKLKNLQTKMNVEHGNDSKWEFSPDKIDAIERLRNVENEDLGKFLKPLQNRPKKIKLYTQNEKLETFEDIDQGNPHNILIENASLSYEWTDEKRSYGFASLTEVKLNFLAGKYNSIASTGNYLILIDSNNVATLHDVQHLKDAKNVGHIANVLHCSLFEEGRLKILCSNLKPAGGTFTVSLYNLDDSSLKLKQILSVQDRSTISSWNFNDDRYMMLTPIENAGNPSIIARSSKIYKWDGEMFRHHQNLPSNHPGVYQQLDNGFDHFIILREISNFNDEFEFSLMIYILDKSTGFYTHFQELGLLFNINQISAVQSRLNGVHKTFLVTTNIDCSLKVDSCATKSATIYSLDEGEFVAMNHLETHNDAVSFAFQKNNDAFIGLLSTRGLSIYRFDGIQFVKEDPLDVFINTFIPDGYARQIEVLQINQKHYLAVLTDSSLSVYKIHFVEQVFLKGPNEELERWCEEMASEDSYIKSGTVKTRGRKFDGDFVNYVNVIENEGYDLFDSEFDDEVSVLRVELAELEKHLAKAEDKLQNYVPFNGVWPDNLRMYSVVIENAKTIDFDAGTIDGEMVPIEADLLPLKGSKSYDLGTKIFKSMHIKNLSIDSLNGHSISSYITYGGSHTLSSHAVLLDLHTDKIEGSPIIDNVRINKDNILLREVDQNITGMLHCYKIQADNLETSLINNIDIKELMNVSVNEGLPAILKGNVHIVGNLLNHGNLKAGKVMGMHIEDEIDSLLLRRSEEVQTVTGLHHYGNLKTNNLKFDGLLNNLTFPESVFINVHGNLYKVRSGRFADVYADEVVIDSQLNYIMVDEKKEFDILTLTGDQYVSGHKTFFEIHLKDQVFKWLNLNDSSSFYQDAEFRKFRTLNKDIFTRYQEYNQKHLSGTDRLNKLRIIRLYLWNVKETRRDVTPTIETVGMEYMKYLHNSLVYLSSNMDTIVKYCKENGDIDVGKIVTSDQIAVHDSYMKQAAKLKYIPLYTFDRVVQFYKRNSDVIDMVDIKIEDMKNKLRKIKMMREKLKEKLLQLGRNLNITDQPGSHVYGLISGYDFNSLPKLETDISYGRNITVEDLNMASKLLFMKNINTPKINDILITRMITKALPLSASEINMEITFDRDVRVESNLESSKLNGDEVSSFATIDGMNVFSEDVQFRSIDLNHDATLTREMNGLDIKGLESHIALKSRDQMFSEDVIFEDLVVTKSIDSDEVELNGIPISEFISTTGPAIVTGTKIFESIELLDAEIYVKSLNTSILDGVDISIPISNEGIVSKDLHLNGTTELNRLHIKGNLWVQSQIESASSKEMEISRFLNGVINAKESSTVDGNLVFGGKVYIQDLEFHDTFEGISADQFKTGWVLNDTDQYIEGKNRFYSLDVINLKISSNHLQVDLHQLVNESVKINQDVDFSDVVYFENVDVGTSISLDGLVQGYNLGQDALLNNQSEHIHGIKQFTENIHIEGDFDVQGLINQFDVEARCKELIGTVLVNGSVNFERNSTVDHIMNGSSYFPKKDVYWFSDQDVIMKRPFVFKDMHTDSIDVTNKINGLPINIYIKDQISENCSYPVKGYWTVTDLQADHFKTNDIIADFVNGEPASIYANIILNNTDQNFDIPVTLLDMTVKGELNISGPVNGIDFADYCLSTVPCDIQSAKVFLDDVVVNRLNMDGDSKLNNMKISEFLNYNGHPLNLIIEDSLTVPTIDVSGYINGTKISAETILTKSGDQTMTGSLMLTNMEGTGLALKAVEVYTLDGLYDGINLPLLWKEKSKTLPTESEEVSEQVKLILQAYKDLSRNILKAEEVLLDQVVSFEGWELSNDFEEETFHITPVTTKFENYDLSRCVAVISYDQAKIWKYSESRKKFVDIDLNIPVKCITDVKGYFNKGLLYIATSSRCPNPDIDLTGVPKIIPLGDETRNNVFSFIWKISSSGKPKLFVAVATDDSIQILVLTIKGRNCIVFLNAKSTNQNILCEDRGEFILQSSFATENAIQAVHLELLVSGDPKSLMIVANSGNPTGHKSYVDILLLNGESGSPELLQVLISTNLKWVTAIEYEGSVLLATIHSPFYGTSRGYIKVYSFRLGRFDAEFQSGDLFTLEESFSINHPLKASLLKLPSKELFLMVLDQSGFVRRFTKAGFERFKSKGDLYTSGANHIESWSWSKYSNETHHLSVSSSHCSDQFENDDNEYFKNSFILRPVFKGFKYTPGKNVS